MKRHEPLNILLIAGAVSLVCSVVPALIGLRQFGKDMVGNLLAEVSGVMLEVALVLLVLDWLTKRNQRREWSFAYNTISKRFALVFVDIMRLLFVLHGQRARSVDIERFNDFLDVSFQHLGDLRSHIEGFAVAFEPQTHQQCRQIEQQFLWMLGRIKRTEQKYSGLDDFSTMKKLAYSLDSFLQSSRDPVYHETKLLVKNALAKHEQYFQHGSHPLDVDTLISIRLQTQNDLLSSTNSHLQGVYSIIDDQEMKLVLPYFIVDFLILSRLPEKILHSKIGEV